VLKENLKHDLKYHNYIVYTTNVQKKTLEDYRWGAYEEEFILTGNFICKKR